MAKKIPSEVRSKIRSEYMEGNGSCRELAEKHGLSPGAVENWCRREKWRQRLKELDRKLTAQTERSLVSHADQIVAKRAAFITRTLNEGETFLDDIDSERKNRKQGDVDVLRKLVPCWETVTAMQRKSLNLDQKEGPNCLINLQMLREAPIAAEVGSTM